MTDGPTRGEFDMLKAAVDRNTARTDRIDDLGTKGVAVVQQQLVDLIKDVAAMKSDMDSRFGTHQRLHDVETQDRRSGRRWLISTGIAGLMSLLTIIGLLVEIWMHLKGH